MEMGELRKQLEAAIEQVDHYGCSVIISKMLKFLEARTALEIALDQVNLHLPAFEKLHPQEKWIHQWFELASAFKPVESYVVSGMGYWDTPVSDFGSKAYIYGLSILDVAFKRYFEQKSDAVIELTGNGIECVVNARMSTYLWKQVPEMMSEYEEILEEGAKISRKEQSRRLLTFREHPERRRFIQTYWTQLADEIESHLSIR